MKLLLVLLLFTACGTSSTHTVEGIPEKITIEHTINLDEIEEKFINECVEEFPNDEVAQDLCVQEKLDNLYDLLDGLLNSEEDSE